MRGEVFVSYSRHDQEFVLMLVNDLEDRQAFAWIDRADIAGGELWRSSIEDGIGASTAFLVVQARSREVTSIQISRAASSTS